MYFGSTENNFRCKMNNGADPDNLSRNQNIYTVFQRSTDPFFIVTYYIKWSLHLGHTVAVVFVDQISLD